MSNPQTQAQSANITHPKRRHPAKLASHESPAIEPNQRFPRHRATSPEGSFKPQVEGSIPSRRTSQSPSAKPNPGH